MPVRILTKSGNSVEVQNSVDQVGSDRKKGRGGRVKWISADPSPEEVVELAHRFPEMVKHSKDEVKGETDDWLARGLVARSLDQRVQAKAATHEFQLHVIINGDVQVYNLEHGFMLFRFQDAGERDSVLNHP